jgi:hypothetical protein
MYDVMLDTVIELVMFAAPRCVDGRLASLRLRPLLPE